MADGLPFRTILNELNENKDIDENFIMRKKIYENKELFYQIAEKDVVELENKVELLEITDYVKKGKDLLLKELDINRDIMNVKINLDEFKFITLDICIESQKKINQLKLCFDNQEFDTTELQNHIDCIDYSLGNIIELINVNNDTKSENINKKFIKNNAIIKNLSEIYNIFKSSASTHICPACISNEVDVFCNCGHTFCNSCISKSKYCYLCRAQITKINKLYF